jgi:hypothetical protein
MRCLDLFDGLIAALSRPGCDVDAGVVLVEDLCELFAETTVASSDDEDLSSSAQSILDSNCRG